MIYQLEKKYKFIIIKNHIFIYFIKKFKEI